MAGWKRSVRAHHEAGHAVIARVLGINFNPHIPVTARADAPCVVTESAGYRARTLGIEAELQGHENDGKVALAGLAAQRRSHPDQTTEVIPDEDEGDIANAEAIARTVAVLRASVPAPEDGVLRDPTILADAQETFDRLVRETDALIGKHWPAIKRVARALENRDSIDQAEVDRLIVLIERHVTR